MSEPLIVINFSWGKRKAMLLLCEPSLRCLALPWNLTGEAYVVGYRPLEMSDMAVWMSFYLCSWVTDIIRANMRVQTDFQCQRASTFPLFKSNHPLWPCVWGMFYIPKPLVLSRTPFSYYRVNNKPVTIINGDQPLALRLVKNPDRSLLSRWRYLPSCYREAPSDFLQ